MTEYCAYCGDEIGEDINGGWYHHLDETRVICEDCYYEEVGNEPPDCPTYCP